MSENTKPLIELVPETPSHPVSIPVSFRFAEREITMFSITEQELDSFMAGYTSLNSVLFGVAAGALISLIAALATISITNVYTYATFVAGGIVAGVFTVFFGGRMVLDQRAAGQQKQQIKAERRTTTRLQS